MNRSLSHSFTSLTFSLNALSQKQKEREATTAQLTFSSLSFHFEDAAQLTTKREEKKKSLILKLHLEKVQNSGNHGHKNNNNDSH